MRQLKSFPNLFSYGYNGAASSPECRADGQGLRLTMLIVSLWLFMSVILFAIAWYLSYSYSYIKISKNSKNLNSKSDSENFDLEKKNVKILNIVDVVNLDKNETKLKGKSFLAKRAHNRQQLQEPLLCIDEENM